MDNAQPVPEPVALVRPRGSHRFDVFSVKLKRRVTLYRRCALDHWVSIETDSMVHCFSERPGYVQIDGHRYLADFWVSYADRVELVVLPNPGCEADLTEMRFQSDDALDVRFIQPADLAASRIWIDNWKRMLPSIVVTRDFLPNSLVDAVEAFVATPQSLASIERQFSGGDPILARAAAFRLLYDGRVASAELQTAPLCLRTRFEAFQDCHESPKT